MAITYPLSLPTSVKPRRVHLYGINTIGIARSQYTHSTQIQEFNGQSWSADVVFPDMKRETAEEFNAFLLSLMGQKGTFYLGDPLGAEPRGIASGNPKVDGANQTGNSVNTKGWTASITGILLKGDYIQIGNGLHKVLNDIDSDSDGKAALDIWPNLAISPADNELIVTQGAQGVFRLTENTTSVYDANEEKLYSIGFSCIEAR